jgi:hypothetical protein
MCVAFIHIFASFLFPERLPNHTRERTCLQRTLLTREGTCSDDLGAIAVVLVLAPTMLLPATVEIRSGGDAFILLLPPLFS